LLCRTFCSTVVAHPIWYRRADQFIASAWRHLQVHHGANAVVVQQRRDKSDLGLKNCSDIHLVVSLSGIPIVHKPPKVQGVMGCAAEEMHTRTPLDVRNSQRSRLTKVDGNTLLNVVNAAENGA
jgi:hypothetical protein